MRIEELVKAFSNGATYGQAGGCAYGVRNLRIEGDFLFNYHTILAMRQKNGKVVYNDRHYSSSTSRIQTYIRYYCDVVRVVDGDEKLRKHYIKRGY